MRWDRWYRLTSYFRSALWIVPFVALLLENIAIRLVFRLHERLEWLPWFGTTPGGTSEALNAIETLSISFIVFTFGSLLVAIQVASGQLTPRIIATTLLQNNVIRFTVGLFIFTMLFTVGTGARLDSSVTHPAIVIAWTLGVVSIAAFLFLIDYTARLRRGLHRYQVPVNNATKLLVCGDLQVAAQAEVTRLLARARPPPQLFVQ